MTQDSSKILRRVHCVDTVEFCHTLPEGFIDLTVTSPPYNVSIDYDTHEDTMSYEEYIAWLDTVWEALYRAHKDHSYIAVNIGRNTEHNTPAHISAGLEKAGFKFYKSVVWTKPVGAANQVMWYKWPYPRYYEPYLITEDILIYTKGEVKGEFRGEKVDCLDPDFVRAVSTNVWYMQPDGAKVHSGIHPAPFPIELPSRLISLLSLPGEVVYDPFTGSGTTLQAAKELGREYVGTDIDVGYCDYANELLEQDGLF
jgi:DNA modification methylase